MPIWKEIIIKNNCIFIHNQILQLEDNIDYVKNLLENFDTNNNFLLFFEQDHDIKKFKFPFKLVEKYIHYKNLKIIFTNVIEPLSYQYSLKVICNRLTKKYNIHYENIIILSGTLDQNNSNIGNCTTYCFDYFDRINVDNNIKIINKCDYHFVSLARILKPHRVISTIEMIERNLNRFGNMSLGSGYRYSPKDNNELMIPEKYKNLIPLYIDGEIVDEIDNQQYSRVNEKISNAFVNVVMESCYDYEVNKTYATDQFLPYISEKSYKPFLWNQVPIYICCQYSLTYLRDFKFDLFDDIIDHSYDLEPNGFKRIQMAIDQLEKICQKPIEYWKDYMKENMGRFDYNKNRVSQIATIQTQLTRDILNNILAGRRGVEPRLAESKSAVLPLDDLPIY